MYLSDRSFQVNIKSKYSNTAKIECGVPQESVLEPLLFLLYVNDMKQAVDCDLFLYTDDVSKIEQNLNKNSSNICDWFVDNKLRIDFGEDKKKCILFGTKQKLNKTGSLKIRHGTIQIKQYQIVSHLGCALDKNLSGETMALKVISKINCRLLSQTPRRLLCKVLIQPHFDYACATWHPNLNNRLK